MSKDPTSQEECTNDNLCGNCEECKLLDKILAPTRQETIDCISEYLNNGKCYCHQGVKPCLWCRAMNGGGLIKEMYKDCRVMRETLDQIAFKWEEKLAIDPRTIAAEALSQVSDYPKPE